MSDPYASSKVTWHLRKIGALRQGRSIVPTHVQLIISDLCNQNCHFCAYRMDGGFSTEQFAEGDQKNPNRKIPRDKCFEILKDCAELGVRAIQFTGGGEPTVHPDCAEIISYAQTLGLETALVTNGTRLPPDEVLRQLSWLRVSLDSGTSETYEAIRESKLWSKVIYNLERLSKIEGPLIGVGFVITMDNFKEIGRACALVRDCGISYIRLSAMFSEQGSGYYGDVIPEILETIAKAKEEYESDGFKIVDLFSQRIHDLDQGRPEQTFCGYQRFTLYIGGDQKLYRCCTTSYTKHGEIGDLKNLSFLLWWERYSKEVYEHFDARTCHHCQFNAQNRVINYLLEETPTHVNFV